MNLNGGHCKRCADRVARGVVVEPLLVVAVHSAAHTPPPAAYPEQPRPIEDVLRRARLEPQVPRFKHARWRCGSGFLLLLSEGTTEATAKSIHAFCGGFSSAADRW